MPTILEQARDIISAGCGCDHSCSEMDPDYYCGCKDDANKVLALGQAALDAAVKDTADAAAIYEAEIERLRGCSPDNAVLDRVADEIIAGLRRENDNPFSGLALDPIEAIELLRRRVKSQSSGLGSKE